MNTSRKHIKPYILAGIRIALIVCFFIPFYLAPNKEFFEYNDVYNAINNTKDYPFAYCISFFNTPWTLASLLIYINCANIFIQAHGCNKTFSIISAVAGFIEIIQCHTYNSRMNFGCNFDERHYSIAFYLIILLLLAQLILPLILLVIKKTNKESRTDITV